jgi:signal transduction histidine kinase
MSLRWRLTLSYVLLTLLSVGVVGAVTYKLAENYAAAREIEGLSENAQAIALQAEPLMYSPFGAHELQQLAETSAYLGDLRVRILDVRGREIADSGLPGAEGQVSLLIPVDSPPGVMVYRIQPGAPLELPPELAAMLPPESKITIVEQHDSPWGKQFTFKEVSLAESESLTAPRPGFPRPRSATVLHYPIGDPLAPIGYVELSAPLDYGSALLKNLRSALLVAGSGAVLLAVLLGLWNSRRITAPLKSLARTASQMGAGDLSVRADIQTGGEIGALAGQFNQMADSLQGNIRQLEAERDALRRFIADASHELRTPITALKNFNALLQGPAADDPQAQAEFLAESQTQIERLAWITGNLLDLSRLDAGLLELDLGDCDLREVLDAAAAPFRPPAAEKGVTLVLDTPDTPVTMTCDRHRLEMAVGNLVDNALKFTPAGGEIRVSLVRGAERILVRVRDTGAGISPEDLPHIFERFYRGRGETVPGSGLGLAIVKSIVEAHGGEVSVESEAGKGTEITLAF